MRSINILHLSDLHVNSNNLGKSKPLFDDLGNRLKSFFEREAISVDLLLISGDLSDKGGDYYRDIENRINKLCDTLKIEEDHVFITPGNHDINREMCKGSVYTSLIHDIIKDPQKMETFDKNAKEEFYPGFQNYINFSSKFLTKSREKSNIKEYDLPGFYHADISMNGTDLRICSLNSAITAGPEDDGKKEEELRNRVVCNHIISKMLDVEDKQFIFISHYPLSWIHPKERQEATERLQHANAIYFHGHIHEPELDFAGVQESNQLLKIGAGTIYGLDWQGSNQCQLLELTEERKTPHLHEWFWFSKFGWRKFEPLEVCWGGWHSWYSRKEKTKKSNYFSFEDRDNKTRYTKIGLLDVGKGRKHQERILAMEDAIESSLGGSDFYIIGRSLKDWALLYNSIENAINEKKINFKIALLDENTIIQSKKGNTIQYKSWIEMPIEHDWAIDDVQSSMVAFKRINIKPGTGSLTIYGLPFYPSHSFFSFESERDNKRYCLEEAGMALKEDKRPFIALCNISESCYSTNLEKMYENFLTEKRIIFKNDGLKKEDRNNRDRSKDILPKIEKYGLVDLSLGRKDLNWMHTENEIKDLIQNTPANSEIFIVGRSLVAWTNHKLYEKIAEAIVNKKMSFKLVIADPKIKDLKSLVYRDYAEEDLERVWDTFRKKISPKICEICSQKQSTYQDIGKFELYGIPAYIPVTFACYVSKKGQKYCQLEVGIGVTPDKRPNLIFSNIPDSNDDFYSNLYNIYKGIISKREPIIQMPPLEGD